MRSPCWLLLLRVRTKLRRALRTSSRTEVGDAEGLCGRIKTNDASGRHETQTSVEREDLPFWRPGRLLSSIQDIQRDKHSPHANNQEPPKAALLNSVPRHPSIHPSSQPRASAPSSKQASKQASERASNPSRPISSHIATLISFEPPKSICKRRLCPQPRLSELRKRNPKVCTTADALSCAPSAVRERGRKCPVHALQIRERIGNKRKKSLCKCTSPVTGASDPCHWLPHIISTYRRAL